MIDFGGHMVKLIVLEAHPCFGYFLINPIVKENIYANNPPLTMDR